MARNSYHLRSAIGTTYAEVAPATYVVAADSYPTTRNGLTFGWPSGTTPATQDRVGPISARISGRHAVSSNVGFRVDLGASGRVRVWLALGALGVTANTAAIIQDGNGANGGPGTTLATIASTSVPSGSVMDATGAIMTIADWVSSDGGAYVEVIATTDHIFISRTAGVTFYLSCVETESLTDPLQDATFTDDAGLVGGTVKVWGKDPAGKPVARLGAPNGQQVFSMTPGHSSANYFATATIDGAPWLVTTANRLPDNYADGISVRQTSLGVTRDTLRMPTVVPAGSRPVDGSVLGQTPTEVLLARDKIRAVTVGELRPAHAAQAFASDVLVTSLADMLLAIANVSPTGTSWHRIRLATGGSYGTYHPAVNIRKDMGTGGIVIESQDPLNPVMVNGTMIGTLDVRGLQFRRVNFAPPTPASGQTNVFQLGTGGSLSAGPYLALRFDNCNIGEMFDGGTLAGAANDEWRSFFQAFFYEQIVFNDCTVDGVDNFLIVTGRMLAFTGTTQIKNVRRDYVGGGYAFRLQTPTGVFLDNNAYVHFDGTVVKNNPDIYAGLSSAATPHGDLFQTRRSEGGYGWTVGKNGGSQNWVVNDKAITKDPGSGVYRIYQVRSVTTGQSDGPMPTGTATDGIVSGGVTWGYVQDFALAGSTSFVLYENVAVAIWGNSVNAGTPAASPNIQFIINSNSGVGMPTVAVAINCVSSSGNGRGLDTGGDGTALASYCSFTGPRSAPVQGGASVGIDQPFVLAGVRGVAWRCVLGVNAASKPKVDTAEGVAASILSVGCAAVQWKGVVLTGQAVDPPSILSGPFTRNSAANTTGGDFQFTALDDANATAPSDFVSSLSRIMHPIGSGDFGGRLREKHTVTVGGVGYLLQVAP